MMLPFALPLALKALPWKWLAIAAGAIAVLLALWWLHSAIYSAGQADTQAKWDKAVRAAEAKAAADTVKLHATIAEIDVGVTANMEAISDVRTIYRDRVRTIAVDRYRDRDCALPDGLRAEINAAAAGYAAAAAGPGGPAVRPAKPAP